DADVDVVMKFYDSGRKNGNFETGIENALAFMLTAPKFLFRTVTYPPSATPGSINKVGDLELASRLSFFLWSSLPDDELLNVASQGKLKDPAVLDQQVKRMLADSKSQALIRNFAGQWLFLRNLQSSKPDGHEYPNFDDNLRQAFRRETELFFDSILRENRS